MTAEPTTNARTPPEDGGARVHMGVAEQGKLYALEGDHRRALFYYRQAMQMAVEARDPEIFFRHYLECVIETLEHMGSYDEVVEYCDKAIRLYQDRPPEDEVSLRDLAHIHQRLGVVRLKDGDREGAKEAFKESLEVLAGSGQQLPLASKLLRWLEVGMHLDTQRIDSELEHADYFSVREATIDRERAVRLPDAMIPAGLGI